MDTASAPDTTDIIPDNNEQRSITRLKEIIGKFNIVNLLFCYCLPFFYVFYPALLMPAIFLRSLSFVIGWAYKLIAAHHHHSPIKKNNSKGDSNPAVEDDEMNNMYFWLQRCSICLDQTYSLCLENCRDQFCKDCFARYIEVTVNQSWGLGVSRIKCPVCQETISQSEWSRYVSPEIVDKYNRFNHPYRPFSRHCHGCASPIAPCQSPRAQGISRESRLERIASYLDQFSQATHYRPHKQMMDQVLDLFLKTCQTSSTFRVGKVQELYHQIIPSVLKVVKRQPDMYDKASTISKHLVALEMIPEAWKQIQFWHISNFPTEACAQCHDKICLQCGEAAHVNLCCLDNLRLKLKKEKPESEWASTIQWKLNHTRPCPNCSVMINRDEGCNRVDCLLCGHTFCWRCGSGWSQQTCGFYQCGESDPMAVQSESSKTELGVPDMHAIDARRQVVNL